MDAKIFWGILATIIACGSYVPYFDGIFKNKTKPHAISWFLWGLSTTIIFFAQITSNGGAGSWVTGLTAIVCYVISVFGLLKSDRKFSLFDWVSLAGALLSLVLWKITSQPLSSVILLTVADGIAFFPTYRKSFLRPHEEKAPTYVMAGLKFIVSLFALGSFTSVTALFPIAMIVLNWSLAGLLLIRRNQIESAQLI